METETIGIIALLLGIVGVGGITFLILRSSIPDPREHYWCGGCGLVIWGDDPCKPGDDLSRCPHMKRARLKGPPGPSAARWGAPCNPGDDPRRGDTP